MQPCCQKKQLPKEKMCPLCICTACPGSHVKDVPARLPPAGLLPSMLLHAFFPIAIIYFALFCVGQHLVRCEWDEAG